MKKEAYFKLMGLDKRAWGPSEVLAEKTPDYIRNTAKAEDKLARHYFTQAYNAHPDKQKYKYLINQGRAAQARANDSQALYEKKLKDQLDTAKGIGFNYRWLTDLITPSTWFKR